MKHQKASRRRKQPKPTITSIDHLGTSEQAGHVERLNLFTKRALELVRNGLTYAATAETIAAEFRLTRVPCVATIANWINKGDEAYRTDIEALRLQMRMDQVKKLERMLARWTPVALGNSGNMSSAQLKADAGPSVGEQLEATKVSVKLLERMARLLGLDLQALKENNDGIDDRTAMQLFIIRTINEQARPEPGREVLELKSGLEEL
jgi:hypothetical protein